MRRIWLAAAVAALDLLTPVAALADPPALTWRREPNARDKDDCLRHAAETLRDLDLGNVDIDPRDVDASTGNLRASVICADNDVIVIVAGPPGADVGGLAEAIAARL